MGLKICHQRPPNVSQVSCIRLWVFNFGRLFTLKSRGLTYMPIALYAGIYGIVFVVLRYQHIICYILYMCYVIRALSS